MRAIGEDTNMLLRTGLIAVVLAGLGTTAMASDHFSVRVVADTGAFTRVDARWGEGDRRYDEDGRWRNHWDRDRWGDRDDRERHEQWEGRHWGRHWEGDDWRRGDWHRRYWEGHGWIYAPAPPYGWHWDAYRGRYCP
jgi:hypothetical protein